MSLGEVEQGHSTASSVPVPHQPVVLPALACPPVWKRPEPFARISQYSTLANGQHPEVRLSQADPGTATPVIFTAADRGDGVQKLVQMPGDFQVEPKSALEDEPGLVTKFVHARWAALERAFCRVFFPVGYPHSVEANYLHFAKAMALQVVFSHMSRVLATQAMLLAVGVGSKAALPLAAVTAWVLKDGLGHLLAIGFGTLVNTRFDSDPKRYRFQAAMAGKLADMLSIFTLRWPEHFLVLSTIGGAFTRLSTGTASSCRPKIYETFAINSNLGDVLRCCTAQSTAAQLLGTALGAALGPVVGADVGRLLTGNVVFSACSMYCCYHASARVRMSTLNVQRAERLFLHLGGQLRSLHAAGHHPSTPGLELDILSLEAVQDEEVFVRPYDSVFKMQLQVNPALDSSVLLLTPAADLPQATHVLGVHSSTADSNSPLLLWFCAGASSEQVAQGFLHACLFRELQVEQSCREEGLATERELFTQSAELAAAWWPTVAEGLRRQRWRLDVVFLDSKERRLTVS